MRALSATAAHRDRHGIELSCDRDRRRAAGLFTAGGLRPARRSQHHRCVLKEVALLLVRRTRKRISTAAWRRTGRIPDTAPSDVCHTPHAERDIWVPTMKRLFFLGTVLATLLLPVVACQPVSTPTPSIYAPVPTVVEPGLAYGEPCSPPCWQGLTPGKSTSTDIAKVIKELQVSGWTVSDWGNPEAGFTAYPSPATIRGAISVYAENSVVSYTFGSLLFDYTVSELVHQIGEPENLYPIYRVKQSPKASCAEQNVERTAFDAPMIILYPSRGMIFTTSAPITALGLICPEMEIMGFCYYTPLPIQEALKDDYVAKLCGFDGLKGVTEEDLIKWHGFGSGY